MAEHRIRTGLVCSALTGVTLILAGASAPAVLLSHDDFDYTVGVNLSGRNGYAAEWGGNWQSWDPQPQTIKAGSLTDPSGMVVTSGNMASADIWLTDPSKQGTTDRPLGASTQAALNGDQTGTAPDAWVSFLIRRDEMIASNAHKGSIYFGNGLQYQPGFAIGANLDGTGQGTWQFFQGDTPWVDSGQAVALNESTLIVARLHFRAGNNVDGTIWVNPTPGLDTPATAGVTAAFPKPFASNGGFGIAGREWSIDELRFGNTYRDVTPPIPEPTSLALVALGGLALLRRRR